MRKLVSGVVALAVALVLVACTPEEASNLDAVNAFRKANGLPALQWEDGAYEKVRAWSAKMAADGKLSHSKLSDGVPAGWRALGENVAVNPSLADAQRRLQDSPGHRANLLNPKFTKIAIGVVHHDGHYWVTQLFIG